MVDVKLAVADAEKQDVQNAMTCFLPNSLFSSLLRG